MNGGRMDRLSYEQAFDEIDTTDPERAHAQADELLLSCVSPEVRAAYRRVVDRAPWWASA